MDVTNRAVKGDGRVTAILGPTNTGKTHYAIEQMLSYKTGCIGFPLRLLARENYDRVCEKKGKSQVALLTGEEKILPPFAKYFLCTVESMPIEQEFEFLAVDEIQLCADPDRGHIFTDRMLRARGTEATMFMGAETIRPVLTAMIPNIEIVTRPRLSVLEYTGFKKLTRLNKRSAIVAFSIDDVYAIADLVRRQKGGTAVVLGALSPRTRNAQVEMYQSGEVDFMVATDAIGMGLNMDIRHVALAATRKYDGEKPRNLTTAELAQIAGRAGRYMKDGTFGVTGNVRGLDPDVVEAIEKHEFETLKHVYWRNADLDYHSPLALLKSLERGSGTPMLQKGRASDDYLTLTQMMDRDDVLAAAHGKDSVRLLWDVCQVPDFRKTLAETHQELCAEIFLHLADPNGGILPDDWMEAHISRLNSLEGDVDTLMARIAHVRTWTYVTHRADWVQDPEHWRGRTLAIEDRLSEALHEALTKRFVDKRSAVLLAKMEEGSPLLAGVRRDGEVIVEGQSVGKLTGFRFYPAETSGREEFKAIMMAARAALKPEIGSRLSMLLKSEDKQFKLADDGHILWQQDATNPLPGEPVAKIRKGDALLKPQVEVLDSNLFDGQDKEAIRQRIFDWLERYVHFSLEPLFRLTAGEDVTAQARGIAFQLQEALGILPRSNVEDLIAGLDEEGRKALRARKVRMGPLIIFMPELNKPAAIKLRAILLSLWQGRDLPAVVPRDGMVSITVDAKAVDADYYRSIGYPVYGPKAIRVDMLDRVICAVYDGAKDGKFQAQHKMAEWLGTNILDLYAVLEAMGHKLIHDPAADKVKDEPKAETDVSGAVSPAVEALEAIAPVESDVKPAEEAKSESSDAGGLDAAPLEEVAAGGPQMAPVPVSEEAPATVEAKPEIKKPELATFRLKRGKANEAEKPREKRPWQGRKTDDGKEKTFSSPDKKPFKKDERKPFNKSEGKKPFAKDGERKPFKGKRDNRDDREERNDRGERVYSSAPKKVEDSPFAILQQLKQGNEKKN